jgi:DNA-directed RNA polymerase subunit beta'
MATTTVGRVLLKFYVPQQFHGLVDDAILDSKGIFKLFSELAEKAPTEYSRIASDLTRLGFEIATRQGTSITLKDLVSPVNKDKLWDDFEKFKTKVEATDDSKASKDNQIFNKYNNMMSDIEKDILAKGLKDNKSLAKIILAGSRGSPSQYRGTIATQGIVVDASGKPKMDIPIKSSFAEGLTLPEYLTTSYGTRSGEVLKKISVAQGGYGSKQFARALMPLQVVESDCETLNGIDVSVNDRESIGAFLAKTVGGHNRNNEVTAKLLADLKNKDMPIE